MRYLLVGASFCLAAFVAVDLLATAWTMAVFAVLRERAARWTPAQRRRFFAVTRTLPCLVALTFVALVVVPGYRRLEPHGADESVGVALFVTAVAAVLLLASGPARALRAWRATRRVEAEWLRRADRVELAPVRFPVWRVRAGAEGLWMSGLLRPRFFVGAGVLDALTPLELAAALRHELAHAAGHDNLLRLGLAGAPGTLSIVPFGRMLERGWAQAAETAADRSATAGAPAAAIDLASALVKVARLRPPATLFAASAIDEGDVGVRVHTLLDGGADVRPSPLAEWSVWAALLIPLTVVAALAASPTLIGLLHGAAEQLVRHY